MKQAEQSKRRPVDFESNHFNTYWLCRTLHLIAWLPLGGTTVTINSFGLLPWMDHILYTYQLHVQMLPFLLVSIQYCMDTSLGTTCPSRMYIQIFNDTYRMSFYKRNIQIYFNIFSVSHGAVKIVRQFW